MYNQIYNFTFLYLGAKQTKQLKQRMISDPVVKLRLSQHFIACCEVLSSSTLTPFNLKLNSIFKFILCKTFIFWI